MSGTILVVLTAAGRTNTPPATLNAELITNATSLAPGLTVLPGALIEDISSTDTGALIIIDQAVTETLDSITPYGANAYLLTELGQIYLGQGSTAAPASNTAVYTVFSGTAGQTIAPGFLVSDGTYQYTVQNGGIIETGGTSEPLYCLATVAGSWAVPANTVTTIATSLPTGVSVTCTNPQAGTPGGSAQTEGDFRAQVLQAGLVTGSGTQNYLKTLLQAVPGVVANLISVRSPSTGMWEVIVGGTGDPYAIGYAIFRSGIDVSRLVGSTMTVASITNANPGVVVTTLNHGYTTGQVAQINGATGITGINGVNFTATVIDEKTFSIGINTTSSGSYTGGGVLTPNFRNTSVTINEYPDSYTIPIVIPPAQTVAMTVTWNTSSLSFVSSTAVAQLAQPALADYINAIPVGAPINELEMTAVFQAAVVSLIPTVLLTRLVFSVSINGIVTAPDSGTGIVEGDPESYFSGSVASITVIQG